MENSEYMFDPFLDDDDFEKKLNQHFKKIQKRDADALKEQEEIEQLISDGALLDIKEEDIKIAEDAMFKYLHSIGYDMAYGISETRYAEIDNRRNKIPFMKGRPIRDLSINDDDIVNLKIALGLNTVEEFLKLV